MKWSVREFEWMFQLKVGAMLADAGVGAEQEADKRISAAQNER